MATRKRASTASIGSDDNIRPSKFPRTSAKSKDSSDESESASAPPSSKLQAQREKNKAAQKAWRLRKRTELEDIRAAGAVTQQRVRSLEIENVALRERNKSLEAQLELVKAMVGASGTAQDHVGFISSMMGVSSPMALSPAATFTDNGLSDQISTYSSEEDQTSRSSAKVPSLSSDGQSFIESLLIDDPSSPWSDDRAEDYQKSTVIHNLERESPNLHKLPEGNCRRDCSDDVHRSCQNPRVSAICDATDSDEIRNLLLLPSSTEHPKLLAAWLDLPPVDQLTFTI
ncbi:hypothetical protein HDU93_009855 [Gonapodya sp. JEL0774]|nr:hypothetical protein HDU93_009855 [Gonapodya sp. JEL0774]